MSGTKSSDEQKGNYFSAMYYSHLVRNARIVFASLLALTAVVGLQLVRFWQASARLEREKESYAVYLTRTPAKQSPEAVMIGDPSNPDGLADELISAYNSGAKSIGIRKGTYLLSRRDQPLLLLDRWRDVTISGNGSVLISSETKWGNELFRLDRCNNVKVQDLVLSQTWQTALQGKVVSVDEGRPGQTRCIWRPSAGYPTPDSKAIHLNKGPNVVDGKTGRLKVGCEDEWAASISARDDGSFQVVFGRPVPLQVGDWLVSRGDVAPCKVHLENCRNCTVSNVTCLRNAFGSILEIQGGGNHFLGCRWDVGPKPDGATDPALVSCSVDGFHSNLSSPGPDIENCEFHGVLLDDCISIHGVLQQVVGVTDSTLRVDGDGGNLRVNQPIRIGGKGFFDEATVTGIKPNGDHTVDVTLDKPLNVPVGAHVGNPAMNGPGFRIIGCHIGDTRSRGMLVKGDDGIIDGNTIEGCGLPGISAGPEYPIEGDFVKILTIKNNHFLSNGMSGRGFAAIDIHGGEAMGNRNVTIEGNSFEGDYSGDISLEWTLGAHVQNNTFAAPPALAFPMPKFSPLRVANSADVEIEDNSFHDGPMYRKPLIQVSPEVKSLTHRANKTN